MSMVFFLGRILLSCRIVSLINFFTFFKMSSLTSIAIPIIPLFLVLLKNLTSKSLPTITTLLQNGRSTAIDEAAFLNSEYTP